MKTSVCCLSVKYVLLFNAFHLYCIILYINGIDVFRVPVCACSCSFTSVYNFLYLCLSATKPHYDHYLFLTSKMLSDFSVL